MSVLTDAIKRLLENPDTLKRSDFSLQQRKALESFASQTRLIEIVKQGRSTVYRVINAKGLSNYYRQLHPLTEPDLPADIPARSRNVGLNRSSKQGKSRHDSYYLLMKSWAEGVVWRNKQYTLEVSTATQQFGAAVIQVNADQAWRCNRSLLFVENQALFDQCDWLNADFDGCLIYYGGQLSDTLLLWLSETPRSEHLTLFPDYDGIGLSNFVRLADAIHPETKLSFYWLPDWRNKLLQFGDPVIWSKTRVQFENAMKKLNALGLTDKNFDDLSSLCHHHGKALEQESIWL